MLAGLVLLWASNDGLEKAVVKTAELKQYAFVETVERQGKTGSGSGKVDGPVMLKKSDLGTLYRKGEVEVLHHPSGAATVMEALPEGPMPAPHEVLVGIAKALKDVKSRAEEGHTVFTGTLDEEVAKKHALLLGTFRKATVEFRTDAEGRFVKGQLTLVTQVGGRDLTLKSTLELTEIGSTRIEVPKEVAKLLRP